MNEAWQLFVSTGNISHYMLYRAVHDKEAEQYHGHDN